jgi:hypothetical protein
VRHKNPAHFDPVHPKGAERAVAAAALVALLALSACAPAGKEAAAAAEEFHQAVDAGQMSEACSLLQPATREETARTGGAGSCENQLQRKRLPNAGKILHTERYGRNALVEFEKDTVFLTASEAGWKITAAGCTPEGDAPYMCEVGGR